MSVSSVNQNPLMASLLASLAQSQSTNSPAASYPPTAAGTSSQSAASPALTGSSEASLSDEIIGALVMMQAQDGTTQSGASAQSANPLAQAFSSLDTNGDGSISQSELENAIEGAGGTAAEADQVYTALGGTATTGISQSSFDSAAQSGMSALTQTASVQGPHHHHHHHGGAAGNDEAEQIFSAIDGNDDGSISQGELSAALGTSTDTGGTATSGTASSANANSLFASIDTNGDGSISQGELTTYLNSLQSQIQGDQTTLGSFTRLANNPYHTSPVAQPNTQNITA
jgi:Ca2+-binding EF-hand superfamily protein